MPKTKSQIFEIENIIDTKFDKTLKLQLFLVRWKGYTKRDDTWEPLKNLKSCSNLVNNILHKKRMQKSKSTIYSPYCNMRHKFKVYSSTSKSTNSQPNKLPKTTLKSNSVKKIHSNLKVKAQYHIKDKKTIKPDSKQRKRERLLAVIDKRICKKKRNVTKCNSNKEDISADDVKDDVSIASDDSLTLYSLNDSYVEKNNALNGCQDNGKMAQISNCNEDNKNLMNAEDFACLTTVRQNKHQFTAMYDEPFSEAPNRVMAASSIYPLSCMADIPANCSFPAMPNRPGFTVNDDVGIASDLPIKRYKVSTHLSALSSRGSDSSDEDDDDTQVERRLSIRQTECAFRYKNIAVKKCNRYTQVWLSTNTRRKNSLNPQVIEELLSVLDAAKFDDSHLLMLSALSNVFCSGVDLHYLLSGERKVSALMMVDAVRDLCKALITFSKPIIAVVNGSAIGLGMALLPLCDIVYASDKATFHLPYSKLRQTPEGCASYNLPNILGFAMANDMLMGGRKITATEAHQLGLVSRVFWPTSLMQEAIPLIERIALNSAKVMASTKLLVRSHQRTKLELTNESECNLLLNRWSSRDCHKAIQTYLDCHEDESL